MTNHSGPITVFWNTGAGWDEGEKEAELVRDVLKEVDPDVRFELVKKGDNFREKCREALDNGTEILMAAGGDGTINAVASAAVDSGKTLGVIPAGTLNHFARDLEISLEPKVAAEQFRDGHQIQVDVGSVNGRIFINNSVLGLYPVYRTARKGIESHGLRSTRARAISRGGRAESSRSSGGCPISTLRLVSDDNTAKTLKTAFVLVANNEHELEELADRASDCYGQGAPLGVRHA